MTNDVTDDSAFPDMIEIVATLRQAELWLWQVKTMMADDSGRADVLALIKEVHRASVSLEGAGEKYKDLTIKLTEAYRSSDSLSETLQDICEEAGCPPGISRTDFIRFELKRLRERVAELEAFALRVHMEAAHVRDRPGPVLSALEPS